MTNKTILVIAFLTATMAACGGVTDVPGSEKQTLLCGVDPYAPFDIKEECDAAGKFTVSCNIESQDPWGDCLYSTSRGRVYWCCY